eukprot:EG_transcript_56268
MLRITLSDEVLWWLAEVEGCRNPVQPPLPTRGFFNLWILKGNWFRFFGLHHSMFGRKGFEINMLKEDREKVGITDGLVRVSVGIEDADDLIRSLKFALDNL